MNTKIIGSGSYIPEIKKENKDFIGHTFYSDQKEQLKQDNEVIIRKFKEITGILERRYVSDELNNSDIASYAAIKAIKDADIDPESIDYIILAQNFGNVSENSNQCDMLPSIASRVKHNLGIANPNCVAYDLIFGCPGWVQAMIHADAFVKSGLAHRCLVIGSETLSRVVDPHDRDSMIYSDGAAACILEKSPSTTQGILSTAAQSHTLNEAHYLYYGASYNPKETEGINYIKMHGRKIYEFALSQVPIAMKSALDKSGIPIDHVKKVLIHQANEKMDAAIIQRFYKQYGIKAPMDIMPMSIHKLGNSSVATVPTLFDLIVKGELEGHHIEKGDILLFASVGAGMNINAFVYKY
ncbi:MAG: ketoacyl-ACP synthase III [Crocinitomicaceae bacterium]|tara:strand:+ start:1494 stop:2555 length:1062 start_codon:yes stop_codon:yes gene_type:complete